MRHCYLFLLYSLGLCALASCSSPTAFAPTYPQNPAISDALGHPRDTTTFYFPAADSLHASYIPKNQRSIERLRAEGLLEKDSMVVVNDRTANCQYELVAASHALTYFDAPVLSNYYLGVEIYRFLWLRSFHRPVLITLRQNAAGPTIHTQLLDKYPSYVERGVFHPDSLSLTAAPAARARAKRYYDEKMADPKFLAWVAEGKRRARQVIGEETMVPVTPKQWQHFQSLLKTSRFNRLPACQPALGVLDGARWLLESHQANGYHMVSRQSPDETDSFRKACEYLIDMSSVRNEERY
jgi:hypothetical protein